MTQVATFTHRNRVGRVRGESEAGRHDGRGQGAGSSLRRNLDMDTALLAIAGDFHLLGRV